MNWLTEHLENLKEMVKDCVAGMSSKDKVIACGITSIAAITIAYILREVEIMALQAILICTTTVMMTRVRSKRCLFASAEGAASALA